MANKTLILALLLAIFVASLSHPFSALASSRAVVFADYRQIKLANFLERYNSPLADYTKEFIAAADKYGLDYRLLPAITGVESTFGRFIPEGSYNAYGWNGGNWYFKSWPDSIFYVAQALRENYVNRGAREVWEIAPIYNPVTPSAWGAKVLLFEEQIENTTPVVREILALRLTI